MLPVRRGQVRPRLEDVEEEEVPDPRDLGDALDGPRGIGGEVDREEHPGEHDTWVEPLFLNTSIFAHAETFNMGMRHTEPEEPV
jgi:hypothetical protein